jgi:hypothetical protein
MASFSPEGFLGSSDVGIGFINESAVVNLFWFGQPRLLLIACLLDGFVWTHISTTCVAAMCGLDRRSAS